MEGKNQSHREIKDPLYPEAENQEQDLEKLAELLANIGYPANLDEVLGPDTGMIVRDRFIEINPVKAYRTSFSANDTELMTKAESRIIEDYGKEAKKIFKSFTFKDRLTGKLIEIPDREPKVDVSHLHEELDEAVIEIEVGLGDYFRLCSEYIIYDLESRKKSGDKDVLNKIDRFIEKNPLVAYWIGRLEENKELVSKSLDSLAEAYGIKHLTEPIKKFKIPNRCFSFKRPKNLPEREENLDLSKVDEISFS